jgi:cell division septation protein DedD
MTGRYSIQIRAFQEDSKARAYMEGLTAHKKEVFLQRAVDGSGRVWHRVLLGRFKDRIPLRPYEKQEDPESVPGQFHQQRIRGVRPETRNREARHHASHR